MNSGEVVTSTDGRTWRLQTIACPLCESARSKIVYAKAGAYIARVFEFAQCDECGFVYVSPRVAEDQIPALYDSTYYRGEGFDKSVDYEAPPQETVHHRNVASTLGQLFGDLTQIRVLDLGCGAGHLSRALQRQGVNVSAVDTSEYAVSIARRNGVAAWRADVAELVAAGEAFDAVVLEQVIEHLTDPIGMLREVKKLLRSGGYLCVNTGNWAFVRRQPGTPYLMPEGHIGYFTPKTLAYAYARAGLQPDFSLAYRCWSGWCVPVIDRFPPRLPISLGIAWLARAIAPGFAPAPLARRID